MPMFNDKALRARLAPPLAGLAAALLATACSQPTLNLAGLPEAELAGAPRDDWNAQVRGEQPTPPKPSSQAAATATAIGGQPVAALAEARALRKAGDKAKALAVLEQGAAQHPKDRELRKEHGLLALELGHLRKAETLLKSALDAKAPDWRVYSGLGAVLAASGKQQEAQVHFAKALELAPDHPSVLNNLALSYALDGKADEAERLLKRVGGDGAKQARQNLALLHGMRGNLAEAQRMSEAVLPADTARANVAMLQKLADAATPAAVAGRSADAAEAAAPQPTYRLGGP